MSQKTFDAIPCTTIKSEKVQKNIKWVGEKITSPENRLILGATALMSQPFIDMSNKDVDQKTRNVSVARTIAKIIAGTTTGFLVRRGCISLVQKCSKLVSARKIEKLFTPKGVEVLDAGYKNYQNGLGTCAALVAMTFTNFLIDAPLTKYLTNVFTKKIEKRSEMRGAK